jgi:hypothetical protein
MKVRPVWVDDGQNRQACQTTNESPKEQIKWASPQRGRKNSRRLRPQRRDVKAKRVQVDEIWSFTAAKQKNVAA